MRRLIFIVTALCLSLAAPTPSNASADVTKARGAAAQAMGKAEPLVKSWSEAVDAFSERVREAKDQAAQRLTLQALAQELDKAVVVPDTATAVATTAYEAFTKLANRRRTINTADLALAARYKGLKYALNRAHARLVKAVARLSKPPPAPTP